MGFRMYSRSRTEGFTVTDLSELHHMVTLNRNPTFLWFCAEKSQSWPMCLCHLTSDRVLAKKDSDIETRS